MTTYVALLYSIGLDQGRRLVMGDLRAMAEAQGLSNARTLAATGNLVFEAEAGAVGQIEAKLEAAFETAFGRHVHIIVRCAGQWRQLIAANPFPRESAADGARVAVRIMRQSAPPGLVAALAGFRADGERMAVVAGDPWFCFADDPGRSKLPAALMRRRPGVGTMRNWNTVRRIGEMLAGQ